MADQRITRLLLLQDHLHKLRQVHPSLRITKSTRGCAADAPFPVTLDVTVMPVAATRYDVEGISLTIKLFSSILQQPPSGECISISVNNADLRAQLCGHIGKLLKDSWATPAATTDEFGLLNLLDIAQQHFELLVGSLPEYIEAYEATDAFGASVRRYAVLCAPDSSIHNGLPEEVCQHTRDSPVVSSIPRTASSSSSSSCTFQSSSTASAVTAAAMLDACITDAGTGAPWPAAAGTDATARSQHKADELVIAAAPEQRGQPSAQPHHASAGSPCAQPEAAALAGCTPVCLTSTVGQQRSSTPPAASAVISGAFSKLSAAAAPFQPALADATSSQPVQQQQPATGPQENHVAANAQMAGGIQASSRLKAASPVGATSGKGRQGDGRGVGQNMPPEHTCLRHNVLQHQHQQQGPGLLAQQDLQAVQRRYGGSFRLIAQQDGGHQQQQQDAQEFSFMVRPTDPLWGAARGPLHVTGSLHLRLYPAAGALTLQLNLSRGVTAAELWVLQSCLQQEINQHCAGRQRQLLTAVKWLENFCGHALEQYSQAQQAWAGQQEGHPQLRQQQQQQSQQTYQLSHQQQQRQYRQPSRPRQQQQQQQPQQRTGFTATASSTAAYNLRRDANQAATSGGIKVLLAAAQQPAAMNATSESSGSLEVGPADHQRQQQRQQFSTCFGSSGRSSSCVDDGVAQQHKLGTSSRSREDAQQTAGGDVAGCARTSSAAAGVNNVGCSWTSDAVHGADLQQGGSDDGCASEDPARAVAGSTARGSPDSNPCGVIANNSDSDRDRDSDSDHQSGVDEVQLHGGGATAASAAAASGPGGYAVLLEGLQLDSVGVVEVIQAQLQLVCSRCRSSFTVLLTAEGGRIIHSSSAAHTADGSMAGAEGANPAGVVLASATAAVPFPASTGSLARQQQHQSPYSWAGDCGVCRQELSVVLSPRFVHGGSNVLAGMKVLGCRPLDLLPSVFGASCADCDAVGALRGLQVTLWVMMPQPRHYGQVGAPYNRHCSHCHRSWTINIPAVAFVLQGSLAGGSSTRGGQVAGPNSKNRQSRGSRGSMAGSSSRGVVLVEGTPLPNNGACQHYKHSYRWLRFPCCGMRYPCDLCHEEGAPDGHDAAWAKRMVCGFCSREQPLSAACKHCGKKLATSAALPSGRNTRFWEGGKGCRDVKMLDRRDAHKYRNSKSKTKSAKASRVGPKPWTKGAHDMELAGTTAAGDG